MHATALGLSDLIFSSKMLWACLGCYQCQQQCPQGVRVADVLYELKNLAFKQLREPLSKG
jgi:heterodisulfide reductase subunit C